MFYCIDLITLKYVENEECIFFSFLFQLWSRTVELLQIFLLILEKFYFWVKTVSMFEIPFEQVSLLSEREFVIALNSSNFSADYRLGFLLWLLLSKNLMKLIRTFASCLSAIIIFY